jgi:hypothetical protein
MSAIEYTVRVHIDGSKWWYQHGQLHREDGPAIEYADGTKYWFINGEKLTESEFTCSGKIIVIDGVRYTLQKL